MNYYLNCFPFGAPQSEAMINNEQRFDASTFPEDAAHSAIDPQMLLESLRRHSMALQVCEDQLKPFLRQDPFIPDYFGFMSGTVSIIGEDGSNMETTAYFNTEKGAVLIPNDDKPGHWILSGIGGEKICDLIIPNAMIGYFVMASLGYVSFVMKNEEVQSDGPSGADHQG